MRLREIASEWEKGGPLVLENTEDELGASWAETAQVKLGVPGPGGWSAVRIHC